MELDRAMAFVASHQRGVLITLKADGRPQASNIIHAATEDGRAVRISVTDARAKTRNLEGDPRASLHVTSEDFGQWVVVEADAELSPVAADPHDATVDALVEYYRSLRGEHPDWDDYRRSMVADRRVVVTLRPTHAYGQIAEG